MFPRSCSCRRAAFEVDERIPVLQCPKLEQMIEVQQGDQADSMSKSQALAIELHANRKVSTSSEPLDSFELICMCPPRLLRMLCRVALLRYSFFVSLNESKIAMKKKCQSDVHQHPPSSRDRSQRKKGRDHRNFLYSDPRDHRHLCRQFGSKCLTLGHRGSAHRPGWSL